MVPIDESEWRTRKTRIDARLDDAGWKIVRRGAARPARFFQRHALEEFETANGPADYALAVDGQVLGLVEAKRVGVSPQNALAGASIC